MTDLLKDTLTEHADSTQSAGLNLDAIITTGNRRIRHRRVVAIAGAAMVTLAVLITGLTLIKGPNQGPAPVAPPFAERRATYAVGSEIHYGQDVISIAPKKINAFVQTDSGFAFTAIGERGLFLANGKQIRKISSYPGELTPLTAANHGNLIGWVEDFNDRSESVIYDVAAGRDVVRTAIGNQRGPNLISYVMGPKVIAIDGNYAYLDTFKGLYRWDLNTNEHRLIAETTPGTVISVSSGQSLRHGPEKTYRSGTTLELADEAVQFNGERSYPGQQGYLSPTAEYLLTTMNDPQHIDPPRGDLKLFRTTTGLPALAFRHPDHPRLIFGQWLTDNTFTAVGLRAGADNPGSKTPVDLLTCSAKSLTCETTVPAFSTFTFSKTPPRTAPFTLPIGTPIRWLYG